MKKKELQNRIILLETELRSLKKELCQHFEEPTTVIVPDAFSDIFKDVEGKIRCYFNDLIIDPESGEITAQGQRYVLLRADSLSYEFIDLIKERYKERPEAEAISIGNNFLYDNGKVFGKRDAVAFHDKLGMTNPFEKLAAGPIHFAFSGWANVEIDPSSNPTCDDDYFLKFIHHNSFEAKSWLKAGRKSEVPVCTMNCGYSAGWCEESFGIALTTVELTCEAKGDECCTFIMAPTSRIEEYVMKSSDLKYDTKREIPVFFKRQFIEEELKKSLIQKELLIKEIHHRVKNNLQVVSSLLKLQKDEIENEEFQKEFEASINRVNTMAIVHELMYQQKDFDKLNLKTYVSDLIKSMIQLYSLTDKVNVDVRLNVEDCDFSLDQSIPFALILNEITCNSFKHGIRNGGEFYFHMDQNKDDLTVVIGDNGPGLNEVKNNSGLGISLIDILCSQLEASKTIINSENGLEYQIKFKLD